MAATQAALSLFSSYSSPSPSSASAPSLLPTPKTLKFPSRLTLAPSSRRATFLPPPSAVQVPEKIEKLGLEIKNLTLEEASQLVEWVQETLGVSAAAYAPAAVVAAPGGAAGGEAPAAAEEQTEFDVVIEEVPSSARIAAIKVIRAMTSLDLKKAKDMIEGLPKKIKEGVSKEDADDTKKQLEDIGAKVSIA